MVEKDYKAMNTDKTAIAVEPVLANVFINQILNVKI